MSHANLHPTRGVTAPGIAFNLEEFSLTGGIALQHSTFARPFDSSQSAISQVRPMVIPDYMCHSRLKVSRNIHRFLDDTHLLYNTQMQLL